MGLFEKLFPTPKIIKDSESYFQTLNMYQPVFRNWQGMIYESDRVRAAVDALARHTSKLKLEINGSARPSLQVKLKHGANEYQTISQFLYNARTIYEVDTTLFIVPVLDAFGDVTGVYPITPKETEVIDVRGVPYLKYKFKTGKTAAIELNKCAVLPKFQYDKEFFGAGNSALRETMELITIRNQGINEAVKNSNTIRFIAQSGNHTDPEDLEKEQNRFNQHIKRQTGFLLFPNIYKDIRQVEQKPFVVDAEQQKLIDTNIYNYFGVNEKVLQNSAFGDEWSAFYEGAIENFSIMLSEALTKMLFSWNERSRGAEVMFTSNRLQYMTNVDKLNVSAQMLDRGIMSRNEVRDIWNLPRIEDGDGYIIRGEYYDASEKLNESEDKPKETEPEENPKGDESDDKRE